MNCRIINTLIAKDVKLFFSNRLFGLMSFVGIIFFLIAYFLIPSEANETIRIGFSGYKLSQELKDHMKAEGINIFEKNTENALRKAILKGDFKVGMHIPENLPAQIYSGTQGNVKIYFSSDFPGELKKIYTTVTRELVNNLTGYKLAVKYVNVILGPDMGGKQIPPRKKFIPLLIMLILAVELMSLGGLITAEIESGTLHALLVTPVNISDYFVSKGTTGTGISFLQAIFFVALTGSPRQQSAVILLILFLGVVIMTGISFLIASVSQGMMSVISWGVIAMILLFIPSIAIMLPGPVSPVIRAMPSYYMINPLNKIINYNGTFHDVIDNLAVLFIFASAFSVSGILALRRRIK